MFRTRYTLPQPPQLLPPSSPAAAQKNPAALVHARKRAVRKIEAEIDSRIKFTRHLERRLGKAEGGFLSKAEVIQLGKEPLSQKMDTLLDMLSTRGDAELHTCVTLLREEQHKVCQRKQDRLSQSANLESVGDGVQAASLQPAIPPGSPHRKDHSRKTDSVVTQLNTDLAAKKKQALYLQKKIKQLQASETRILAEQAALETQLKQEQARLKKT